MSEADSNCDFEYETAKAYFSDLLKNLQSNHAQTYEHGQIESLIKNDGFELLRLLMQGYLDQRSNSEVKCAVVGTDDKVRAHCRPRSRALKTLFGEVTVKRLGYSADDATSLFPLDAALNLPDDKYSQGLRCKIAQQAATGSFDEAVKAIERDTGCEVSKRQCEDLSQSLSVDFEPYYASQAGAQTKTNQLVMMGQSDTRLVSVPEESGLLIMTLDGKGVVMREQDLREATRKAAHNSKHKLQTRLSPGEKLHRKRMATVAAVYEVDPYLRSAAQIMGQNQTPMSQRSKVQNKRVWASLRQEPAEVIEQMFAQANRRDPEHKKTWLVLIDGADPQRRDVEAAIARHRSDTVIIQDFVHALEYLWKAAYCLYEPRSLEAQNWVRKHAVALLEGKLSGVVAGMRRSATHRKLSVKDRGALDKCAVYLLKNKKRFDYATALKNGWPIATGIIEGACRHLVKDRMDLTGARWSLDGAEAVLQLRALHCSGDLKPYLKFHFEQEKIRNYSGLKAANGAFKMAA
jgi:hypothetical protein